MQQDKTIAELNEDCEIIIRKEIQRCFKNYAANNNYNITRRGPTEITDMATQLKMESPEMQQLFFTNFQRERCPKMLPSTSAEVGRAPSRTSHKSCGEGVKTKRMFVDAPIQATDEKYASVPRSTMLTRTRQHLCKRNSTSQSADVKLRTVKTQTERCATINVSVSVEPLDFIGMDEKGTNVPTGGVGGNCKNQATQMYEHITQSELFCIEWIHRNLFEVRLNPNTLVIDDKLKDISESACVT